MAVVPDRQACQDTTGQSWSNARIRSDWRAGSAPHRYHKPSAVRPVIPVVMLAGDSRQGLEGPSRRELLCQLSGR
jgi:hypothetical protein